MYLRFIKSYINTSNNVIYIIFCLEKFWDVSNKITLRWLLYIYNFIICIHNKIWTATVR